jgi:hypothetical protein
MVGEQVFGRYRLERRLGRGGMGDVWLARDESLECRVALKFLPDAVRWDPVALAALKEETRRTRQLTHPHIVRIHDFVEDYSYAAISMEYVEGRSLAAERLTRPGQVFAPQEIMLWLPALASALDYAHLEAKLVHRDIKPANILLGADGMVKLSDFGVARTLGESMLRVSQLHTTGGTLLYMSPQQYFGEAATPADDIYALGATLYELLTGKPPFHTGNVAAQIERRAPDGIASRRRQLGVASDVAIPENWESTLAACLAKQAENRPASAGEVVARLQCLAPAPARNFVTYYITNFRGQRASRGVVGLGLVAALGAGFWYYLSSERSEIPVAARADHVFASDASRALAAWNLDGDGRDTSGHGLQLLGAYAVPTVDRHGRIDRAMHFNGNASLLTEESKLLGGDAVQPFTAALWLRLASETAKGTTVLSLHTNRQGEPQWSLGLESGYPLFLMGRVQEDGSNETVRADERIPPGAWTHLLVLSDGREIRLYVNGRLSGHTAMTHSRAGQAAELRQLFLGQVERLDADKFNGDLDQVRLWSRALTNEEIALESDPSPAPRFALTSGRYSEKDDIAEGVIREFGDDARLADWNEIARWHGNDAGAFADELGIITNSTNAYVQRAGKRYVDEKRQYFINRFDGKKPDYFLAHAELGGMTLALGSWFGNKMPALAALPFVAPAKRELTADKDGSLAMEYQTGGAPRIVSLVWSQDIKPGPLRSLPVQILLTAADQRSVGAHFELTADGRFALSLGDLKKPQLSREMSARYARFIFTLVAKPGRLHLRAVNAVGGDLIFQEAVAIPDFNPVDLRELQMTGVDAAELTTEL